VNGVVYLFYEIGTFEEIIADKHLFGVALPENLVIAGACNPVRKRNEGATTEDYAAVQKLVYRVFPMSQRLQVNQFI
jgi:hypothetical protein